jgi:hypothetical protein
MQQPMYTAHVYSTLYCSPPCLPSSTSNTQPVRAGRPQPDQQQHCATRLLPPTCDKDKAEQEGVCACIHLLAQVHRRPTVADKVGPCQTPCQLVKLIGLPAESLHSASRSQNNQCVLLSSTLPDHVNTRHRTVRWQAVLALHERKL